jgi:fibronectin-binding autotransporter adhesin
MSGCAHRTGMLLASTALMTCLVVLVSAPPALAQSVTTSGDVNPSPATSPIWDVIGRWRCCGVNSVWPGSI